MRKVLFLLGHLSDEDVEWLIANGEKQEVAAGTTLIEEGRPIDALYILLRGSLEVSGPQFGDAPLELGAGEVVGEVSLLDSRPPTATVSAATDCVLLALPREDLGRKLEEDEGFGSRFYRSLAVFLAHRLRNTYQQLGYGADEAMDEDQQYEDELSPELLDSVHVAGNRFDRAVRKLLEQ